MESEVRAARSVAADSLSGLEPIFRSKHLLGAHLPVRTGIIRWRGKTVTKPSALSRLGMPLSEKQIPQVVEKLESGCKSKEALETVALRVKQAL